MTSAEKDVPPCPVCGGNMRFCECMDDPFAPVPENAEKGAVPRAALAHLIDVWANELCACEGMSACPSCQYGDRATFLLGLIETSALPPEGTDS